MNDLIKIKKTLINGAEINSVNSRDIYIYLEIKRQYSDWIKDCIVKYDFLEKYDFTVHKFVNGKATQKDYIVNLDMAKELCMISDTIKGKEIRKYFIEAEKQNNKLPTPLETAKMLVQVLEEKEALLLTNQSLTKQNTILMHTNNLYTATEIAKELNLSSANQLNKKLNEIRVQYKINNNWVFYSKYADLGFTSIKQHILENGKVIYDRKFTQTGRDFILKLFSKVQS